jgi:ABC-type lipoprotein export system ATPase subunit
MLTYLGVTEINSQPTSKGEILLFRRGHVPQYIVEGLRHSDQASPDANVAITERHEIQDEHIQAITPQKSIFAWRDVSYDIPVKDGTRRLLDQVSGWIKPGTLTALMGVSGAGKTTLLDVLAQRTSTGVITGDIFVDGKPLGPSFQRKTGRNISRKAFSLSLTRELNNGTGYVQQQDLHLETSTVREALRFSAVLRQPKSVSKKEKYEYVEEVIKVREHHAVTNAHNHSDAIADAQYGRLRRGCCWRARRRPEC